MGKLLYKITVLAFAVSLATAVPVRAEVIDATEGPIVVSITIPAVTSFSVETYNVVGDALVDPLALNFDPSGIALPPGNSWVVSDQYLKVVYSSNYGLWGVRIVTDNEDLEADADDIVQRIAGAKIKPGVLPGWNDGDEVLAYSGLVVLDNPDPSQRAPWAWQVFASTQPAVTPPTTGTNADGSLNDGAFNGEWNDDWAYIADKNDDGYTGAILEDGDLDGSVDDPTYFMAVTGTGGGGGSLAQHPALDPKPGDGDIVIYISARFANTNWGGPAPVNFLLPAGSYDASLYVELVHE